jgi:hypothetical protein
MNIAFFTESGFSGKYPRNFDNSRTEIAWQIALDATHYPIIHLPNINTQFDLGIVILPKKNIDIVSQVDIPREMRRCCKKIAFIQEGPCSYWEDYPLHHQIWFYNTLTEMDVLFCHNECDRKYFGGLVDKPTLWIPSLMIEDTIIDESVDDRDKIMIGGNMCSWYSGMCSYLCASEFGLSIHVPTMGRKIDNEEQMDNLTHLPYMNWSQWISNLKHYFAGVHLMRTHAAGTFALNCSYWGSPCIGYKNLMTQELCHPSLSVELNDIETARKLANRLRHDHGFYQECSAEAKENYKEHFSEDKFLKRFEEYKNQIF